MADLVYDNGSARIRPGTYGTYQLTAAYDWTALPTQSDQTADVPWYPPIDPTTGQVSEVAELVTALDGTRGGFGGYEGSLVLPLLTPGMVTYLRSYLFSGGFSAAVTLMIWDRAQGWIVLNAVLLWNDPAKSAEPRGGKRGYMNLKLDYINGTLADYGRGFSSGFSAGFG